MYSSNTVPEHGSCHGMSPEDAGSLRDKAAVLGETLKLTLCTWCCIREETFQNAVFRYAIFVCPSVKTRRAAQEIFIKFHISIPLICEYIAML